MKKINRKPCGPDCKAPAGAVVKSYRFEVFTDDDGMMHFHRHNDGFNAIELLGTLEKIQLEIMQQMAGTIKPHCVKRIFVDK